MKNFNLKCVSGESFNSDLTKIKSLSRRLKNEKVSKKLYLNTSMEVYVLPLNS